MDTPVQLLLPGHVCLSTCRSSFTFLKNKAAAAMAAVVPAISFAQAAPRRHEGDIKTMPETGSLGGTCAGHVR